MFRFLLRPTTVGFFLFFLFFVFFAFEVARFPLGGDESDFLLAVLARSYPHPSGYPTYTIFGILFSLLPFHVTLAYKVGLTSAFFAALGLTTFYFIALRMSKSVVISIISSLSLAFLYPYWLYALTAEVFSLNYFFTLLLILTSLLYYKIRSKRLLYLLSFVVGLSLTNNLIILVAFPSVGVLLISRRTLSHISIRLASICVLLFCMGLLPYLYLLYGSFHDTLHIWPKIHDISSFFDYVLRKDYGWVATTELPLQNRLLALQSFIIYWGFNLPKFILIVSLLGAFDLLRREKIIFLSLFLGFFISSVVFLTYSANPLADPFSLATLERFYMIPILYMLCCFPVGVVFLIKILLQISKRFHIKKDRFLLIKSIIFLIISSLIILEFFKTLPRMSFSNLKIGYDYSYDILSTLPKNSIIFMRGDSLLFNTLYLQNEYHFREDVFPATVLSLQHFIDSDPRYSEMLTKITSGKKYKAKTDRQLKTVFSLSNIRPVFAEQRVGSGIVDSEKGWVPYGLVFRFQSHEEHVDKKTFISDQTRLISSLHLDQIRQTAQAENIPLYGLTVQKEYADALIRIGGYIISEYKDVRSSVPFFEKAYEINPLRPDPLRALIGVYILEGKCSIAREYTYNLSKMTGEDVSFFTDLIKNKAVCR